MQSLSKHSTKKILLLTPPMIAPDSVGRVAELPLGPAYLAASLEKNGHDVSVLDCIAEGFENINAYPGNRYTYGLNFVDIISRIDSIKPDVLGIGCPSSVQFPFANEIAHRARNLEKPPLIVIGGPHVSALPKETAITDVFDLITIGEAEETLPVALKLIESDEIEELVKIPGLCFTAKDELILTEGSGIVSDLDSLPLPARHLFPMDKYAEIQESASHDATFAKWPFTQVITSRGCPGACSFCSVATIAGSNYRSRSVDLVIDEIVELREKYGIKEVQFEDDNITLENRRAKRLFRAMISETPDMTWSAPNGVALWALDEDLIELMAKSGCYKLIMAIESGVQRVLDDVINKPLKLEKVGPLIASARKHGLKIHTLFVVGFPRETKEEIEQTLKYAQSLKADWTSIFIATPYPGTPLYKECIENGLLPENFSYDMLDVRNPVIEHPEVSHEELLAMISRVDVKTRLKRYTKPSHLGHAIKRVAQDPRRVGGYISSVIKSIGGKKKKE